MKKKINVTELLVCVLYLIPVHSIATFWFSYIMKKEEVATIIFGIAFIMIYVLFNHKIIKHIIPLNSILVFEIILVLTWDIVLITDRNISYFN